jgi:RNA polymerase sigma factor (sigma-70 family)
MMDKNRQDSEDQYKGEVQSLEDTEIIKRILMGEKNLYALLIRKYNQRLYRVGLSILNNESQVEDAMQVSYIKAYENLDKFKFQSSFSTWLTKIIVHESLHVKTKEQSNRRKQQNLSLDLDSRTKDLQTPLIKVLNAELKSILESSIRQLPEKLRTVFIMREMENMSVAETMECLSISEANVKIRLNRAKVMLRDIIRGYLRDDEILQLYILNCDHMVDKVMAILTKDINSS